MTGGKMMTKSSSFRLSAESLAKLSDDAKKANMKRTSYLEKLILEGEVKTLYNGKQLIEIVSRVHDAINNDTMAVRKDIYKVNRNIEELKEACGAKDKKIIQPLAIKAQTVVDKIEEKYFEEIEKKREEIRQCQSLR